MKKIMPVISLLEIVGAISANFVSVNIGDTNGHAFLNCLPDFDWKNIDYGDGLEYNNLNQSAVPQKTILDVIKNTKAENKDSLNRGRYLDYSKFDTGFQYSDGIRKQAVTASPLNEGFMPNGNEQSDFGVTSIAQKSLPKNSILDWNTSDDKDAKYNRSYVPLRKSAPVAFKYPNKKWDMDFNYLGFSSRKHRTYDNTIVGTKNPFENTNLNWQYTSNFVNWSGSWFEGPIIPPPADTIDIAHNNGTPIYGNIFLDGWHGLTKEMLRDFVKRDDKGNYLVVDFLLKLASYNGFDGYFLNDESNGSDPNGTVLDYNVLLDIVRQFNKKSQDSGLDKKIIYYRASGTLSKKDGEYVDKETYEMTKTMPNHKPLDVTLSFGDWPYRTMDFLNENKGVYKNKNLSQIYDAGYNNYAYGTFDWRRIGCQRNAGVGGYDGYDLKVYNSVSGYMDNGAAQFGTEALDLLNQEYGSGVSKERQFIFANQVSNLYNDILFNGLDTNPSVKDEGVRESYGLSSDATQNIKLEFVLDDPRIDIKHDGIKSHDTNGAVKKNIYNYATNGGTNSNSYGVGDMVQEKTVFEDANNNSASIKTDFSTGSGIKFIDRDNSYNPLEITNYPFANRRLADILPTYQWDISELDSSTSLNGFNPLEKVKPKITNLNGFYDYDEAFLKTNSIALGSRFDKDGAIEPGTWISGKKYVWNIIGTNIQNNNHVFSFTYKASKDNDKKTDDFVNYIKPILTITNQDTGKSRYVTVDETKIRTTKDGWQTVQFRIDGKDTDGNSLGINKENRLSKIGLIIDPKKPTFKLNVGEFSMDANEGNNSGDSSQKALDKFSVEYRLERNNLVNLRFYYKPLVKLDYVEFYIKEKDKNDRWFRVGETTANEYFIKDINKNVFGEQISLAAIAYKDNKIVGSNKYEIN